MNNLSPVRTRRRQRGSRLPIHPFTPLVLKDKNAYLYTRKAASKLGTQLHYHDSINRNLGLKTNKENLLSIGARKLLGKILG